MVIKIPVPVYAASAKLNVSRGRAKFEPSEHCLVWKISSFPGMSEALLTGIVETLPGSREKPWVRSPISMDFQIPMYSSSGVQVRFLKVYEKSSYQTTRWVRYLSKAGEYQAKF